MKCSLKGLIGAVIGGLILGASNAALASSAEVQLLPTTVKQMAAPVDVRPLARELDQLLSEAVQDFELIAVPSLDAWSEGESQGFPEEKLVALANRSWVIAPELILSGSSLRLRIVVVAPGSSTLWVRSDSVDDGSLTVLALGLLRELLSNQMRGGPGGAVDRQVSQSNQPAKRSAGRAVLALTGVALGGYSGIALQRASGSDDSRLAYPLAALGAGVGLGAAMVVAEEWDVTPARAWYLGAGAVWPTVGTLLVLEGRGAGEVQDDRHLFGLLGAAGGLTLATAGLSLGKVNEGGAVLTHSGALGGLLLGGLAEQFIEGNAGGRLRRGMGWGTLVGAGLAGVVSSQVDVPLGSDLLLVDVSAVLGGLGAAALGTPLLLAQEPSKGRDRIWIGGVLLGAVLGGAVGYNLIQEDESSSDRGEEAAGGLFLRPSLGSVGAAGLGFQVLGSW